MSLGATGRSYANRVCRLGSPGISLEAGATGWQSHIPHRCRNWTGGPSGSHIRTARRPLLAGLGLAAALMSFCVVPAGAQTWTGATSNDWTVGSNWSGGVVPAVGSTNIHTMVPNPTVLGVNGPAVGTTGSLILGNIGTTSSLTIQNGSTLTSNGPAARIGQGAGSNATLTVTGSGSRWIVTAAPVYITNSGTGILSIENNGLVTAQNGVRVGGLAGSSGTLNISRGGALDTTSLFRGVPGAGQANFDGGTLRATASNASFITGFTNGELSPQRRHPPQAK